jgi:membrane-associated phospholipid phosphatase
MINEFGFYGPHALLAINSIELWNRKPYLIAFLGGFAVNTLVNQVLKNWIKQDRPKPIDNNYGMPSLHAQSVSYATAYLYFVKKSTVYLLAELVICFVTLYQRWKTHMHTPEQLAAGSLIGTLFGYVVYELTRRRLEDTGDSYLSIL